MLFRDGIFSPDYLSDPCIRAILCSVASRIREPVHSHDLLTAAIHYGDAKAVALLSRTLRPGKSLQDVLAAFPAPTTTAPAPAPLTRESFTPQALDALEEFDTVFHESIDLLDAVALEVFLLCVLLQVDDQDQAAATFDVDLAIALLRDELARTISARTSAAASPFAAGDEAQEDSSAGNGLFLLPTHLDFSEDLTERARTAAVLADFPRCDPRRGK
jgi:hypothetical protein